MRKGKSLVFLLLVFALLAAACSRSESETWGGTPKSPDDVVVAPDTLDLDPEDPETAYIKYGKEIYTETATVLPENTGNELSCASCHATGDASTTISLVGATNNYPAWRPREDTIFTMEDRINGCMKRSMNGEELDFESKEMRALSAYMKHISEGVDEEESDELTGNDAFDEVPEPDVDRGEELFESKSCLNCHATDGSGKGMTSGPALWGDGSFNDGAGMNRLSDAAGFIKDNMPKSDPGTLNDQEAADLAAYVLMHDRPVWENHDEDWKDGGRPTDIITQDRRDAIQEGTFDWTELDNVIPKEEYKK